VYLPSRRGNASFCLRPLTTRSPGRYTLLHIRALPGRSTGFKHCSVQERQVCRRLHDLDGAGLDLAAVGGGMCDRRLVSGQGVEGRTDRAGASLILKLRSGPFVVTFEPPLT
jgi:hypothetical protein